MRKFLKKLGILFIIFMITNLVINYVYELPANKAIENKTNKNHLKWTAIHQNKNTYDVIVIGASRAYYAFNPIILDSSLNVKSYNMGTSAQDIAESYYSLQEIFEYQNPKYIILDLIFPSSDDSHDYALIYSNASFFNSSKTKFELISDGYGASGFANYLLPVLKYNNYIKIDIMGLLKKKKAPKNETNWIKGYLHDTITVAQNQIAQFTPISNFQNTTFNTERFTKYFNKIKTLVKENNATLICARTPYPPSRMALNKIDEEGDYYNAFMNNLRVPYYDLNYYKSNKYQYVDEDFADYHHANYSGARKATSQLVEAIKDNKL